MYIVDEQLWEDMVRVISDLAEGHMVTQEQGKRLVLRLTADPSTWRHFERAVRKVGG